METMTENENNTNNKEPIHEATKEEYLLKLFKNTLTLYHPHLIY